MRKTIFAFASVFILLTTFSCKKDKDNSISIIGKWTLVTQRIQYFENNEPVEDSTYSSATEGPVTVEFMQNGSFTTTEDGETSTGTYTYNADSKKLTTVQDGTTSNQDVTELTANSLKIHEDESGSYNGFSYRYIIDASLTR